MSEKVKVAVRVRPFNRREIELGADSVVAMCGNQTILHHPTSLDKPERKQPKTFAFDHCFDSCSDESSEHFASQQKVFDLLGKDILENAFQGYNACLFAYGQTGSGKSYTMMGGQGTSQGIIPRLCGELFVRISESENVDLSYKVEVSYMEIYNEKVHDLLDPKSNKQSLRVREHSVLGPYVDGLSQLAVMSYEDIDALMAEGNKSRTVAATNMNSESSRSHAVFNVVLTQALTDRASGVTGEKVSKLSLVDLAGSERANKTGAAGERLREGSNINRSLTTLGLVISKLAEAGSSSSHSSKDKFVPYRDSVLTWLLKDNLGGNSRTVMVATISPASDNYEETLSTLRYADRAKRIVNHAVVNEDPNARIIRELREEVEALKEALKHANQKEGLHEKLNESEKLMKDLSLTWEEKLRKTERLQQERQQALEKMGISVQASGIKVEKNKYYLVNLNADPSLNELLVYYLKERTVVGQPPERTENMCGDADSMSESDVDIHLSGLGIQPRHCVLALDVTDGQLYVEPEEGARTCVNGSPVLERTQLRHGDRLLWGNHHFFRVNCPSRQTNATNVTQGVTSEPPTPAQPIDWNFAREEIMLKELSNDPIQSAIAKLEKQHEEDKQVALEKQRQEYERQFQQLRNILSPTTPYPPYVPYDPFLCGSARFNKNQPNSGLNGHNLTGSIATLPSSSVQSRVEKWAQESFECTSEKASYTWNANRRHASKLRSLSRDETFKRSLAKLREDIVRANALVREANFLGEEMGKRTVFSVTLQIPPANLSPNRKRGAFVSEPAILVKRKCKGSQVWSMEKLENKLVDMREMYTERKENGLPMKDGPDLQISSELDPFYESQENHNLIGVANVFLEVLFNDVVLDYHVPIISQQGEVAGRLQVEISRVAGRFPQDRTCEAASESSTESGRSTASSDLVGGTPTVTCRVSIRQATGLPPSLSHFVFCQYAFWGQSGSIVVPPAMNDYHSNSRPFPAHSLSSTLPPNFVHTRGNNITSAEQQTEVVVFRFDNTEEFVVPVTEEFLEHCSEGALSIEVWGHRSSGFSQSKPGWEVEQQLAKARSLADRWSEVTRKIELWVEIHELTEQGEYAPVEVQPKPDILTGGVYQLRQGQQRRIHVRVRPVQQSGTLPIICESIVSVAVGSVCGRSKLQRSLDSYQEEDLGILREKWSEALMRRRQYLDAQIQRIINKPDKTEQDVEREQSLVEQWVSLTEERNAVLVPASGSGIPGAPADWEPPPGMETHVPVLFLNLNADDLSVQSSGVSQDGDIPPLCQGGHNLILPKEHGGKFFTLPLHRRCDKDVSAVVLWDSSIHDSSHLNRVTQANERVYLILRCCVRLSHPAPMELLLRKRLCINIYKRQSFTDKIRKRISYAARSSDPLCKSGVTYELVSNIPKASEELEERESLAQMAAQGEDASGDDGETYIEKYTRGVSAVESILTLDRLRQSVAVKELLQAHGRPLAMRKTASVPNISYLLHGEDNSLTGSITNILERIPPRSESVNDLAAELLGNNKERSSGKPFGLATPSPGTVKMAPRMTTLHEEQYIREAAPLLDCEEEEEEESEIEEFVEEDEDEFNDFQRAPEKTVTESSNSLQEQNSSEKKIGGVTPSNSASSGYGSQAVSVTNLSSEDSVSVRSISADVETPETIIATQPEEKPQNDPESNANEEDTSAAPQENDVEGGDMGGLSDTERTPDVYDSQILSSVPEWVVPGESVLIRPYNTSGVVSYIGTTNFAPGAWIGVELDAPQGKNDGTVKGIRYFECRPKHGIFVRPDKLILDRRGRAMHQAGEQTMKRSQSKGGLSSAGRSK